MNSAYTLSSDDGVKVLFIGSTPDALNGEYRILFPLGEVVENPTLLLMIPDNLRRFSPGAFTKSNLNSDFVPKEHGLVIEVFVQVNYKMVKAIVTMENIFDLVEIELKGLALPEFFESLSIRRNNASGTSDADLNSESVKINKQETENMPFYSKSSFTSKIFKERMFKNDQSAKDRSRQQYSSRKTSTEQEQFILKKNTLIEVRIRNVKILEDPRLANFQIFVMSRFGIESLLNKVQHQMQTKANYRIQKGQIDLLSKSKDFFEVSRIEDSFCFSVLKVKNSGSGLFDDFFNCHFDDYSLHYIHQYYLMMEAVDDLILGKWKENVSKNGLDTEILFESEQKYYNFITKQVLYKDFSTIDMTIRESIFQNMKEMSYWPRQIMKMVQVLDFKNFSISANNGDTSVTFKTKSQPTQQNDKILFLSASGNPKSLLNIYDVSFENIQITPHLSDLPISVSFDMNLGQKLPKTFSLVFVLPANFQFLSRPRFFRSCLLTNQEVLDNQIVGNL